jgi:hypothetical protein
MRIGSRRYTLGYRDSLRQLIGSRKPTAPIPVTGASKIRHGILQCRKSKTLGSHRPRKGSGRSGGLYSRRERLKSLDGGPGSGKWGRYQCAIHSHASEASMHQSQENNRTNHGVSSEATFNKHASSRACGILIHLARRGRLSTPPVLQPEWKLVTPAGTSVTASSFSTASTDVFYPVYDPPFFFC